MIGFALAKPMIASSGEQWPLLLPGTGGRYFYVTNIFLFALLLYMVSKLEKYDKYILAIFYYGAIVWLILQNSTARARLDIRTRS